jgi:hypothetical protein
MTMMIVVKEAMIQRTMKTMRMRTIQDVKEGMKKMIVTIGTDLFAWF